MLASKSTRNEPFVMDMRKFLHYLGLIYFSLMTIFIVPIACVATVLSFYPLVWISMKIFILLENRLCRFVNDHWVTTSVFLGIQVTEYGEDLTSLSEKRVLLMANHLGMMDNFVVMQSLHNKGSVPSRWLWLIFNPWKHTPLGYMWSVHGNFFVSGGMRESLLQQLREHLRQYFVKFNYGWIIMYPEGSRLFVIKESGSRFAEKNGLQKLEHCAYPRTGAAHAVMEVMAPREDDPHVASCGGKPPITYIVDTTIGYPKGDVPDLGEAMTSPFPLPDSSRISINHKIIKVDSKWTDETKLKKFLYEQYEKKNKLLDEFYSTGKFPGEGRPVVIEQSMMFISQIFWLGLFYAHYLLWMRPICSAIFTFISSHV